MVLMQVAYPLQHLPHVGPDLWKQEAQSPGWGGITYYHHQGCGKKAGQAWEVAISWPVEGAET